jgi:hypothetical protein
MVRGAEVEVSALAASIGAVGGGSRARQHPTSDILWDEQICESQIMEEGQDKKASELEQGNGIL